MGKVLILGGYGNFGKRISAALARHGVPIVIAGRSAAKAGLFATRLKSDYPASVIETAIFDADLSLNDYLRRIAPAVVINTCGPFQDKDYRIAETCIRHKIHYIDLADGRAFVAGIAQLDAAALEANICVISGASTVPGLSSAVIERYRHEFAQIDSLKFGISPGQKAERGLATTESILSYIGKPLRRAGDAPEPRYGWQDIYRQRYPELGPRWMANCDIPDLDLLPQKYGIRDIRFSAGMESGLLHFSIWGLGWLVRLGLPLDLKKYARLFLPASHWFDRLGSDVGGMHILMHGCKPDGAPHRREWYIVAQNGDGPQIPCVPAIVLAKKLAEGGYVPTGATPCLGLVTLDEYLTELQRFSVRTFEFQG